MKILFVCRGNVGRSQIATGLFTKYTGQEASSAGTAPLFFGKKIREIPEAEFIIDAMKNEGVDISDNIVQKFTPDMEDRFEIIVVMAERETIPDILLHSKKTIFWDIEDPKDSRNEDFEKIMAKLRDNVRALITKIQFL